jgi:hypothetical protein
MFMHGATIAFEKRMKSTDRGSRLCHVGLRLSAINRALGGGGRAEGYKRRVLALEVEANWPDWAWGASREIMTGAL